MPMSSSGTRPKLTSIQHSYLYFYLRFCFFFFPGTICLVLAPVWSQNLSFCMEFATCWHSYFAWYLLHFGMATLQLAWSLLHVAMSSMLHCVCHIQPLICMAFAAFWYFRRSFGFLEFLQDFILGFIQALFSGFIWDRNRRE